MADNAMNQHYKSFESLLEASEHIKEFIENNGEFDIEDVLLQRDLADWDLTIYYRD